MERIVVDFNSRYEREKLNEFLKTKKGMHSIVLRKARRYRGRYKYYFAHVISVIQEKCIFYSENGRLLQNAEIHTALKLRYNPQVILSSEGNKIIIKGKSTTTMSDHDFISKYEQQIIADFSQEPYFCEFLDREDWTNKQIAKHEFDRH